MWKDIKQRVVSSSWIQKGMALGRGGASGHQERFREPLQVSEHEGRGSWRRHRGGLGGLWPKSHIQTRR